MELQFTSCYFHQEWSLDLNSALLVVVQYHILSMRGPNSFEGNAMLHNLMLN